jgi:hypothetical protein
MYRCLALAAPVKKSRRFRCRAVFAYHGPFLAQSFVAQEKSRARTFA